MSKQSKFHIMRLWLGHGVYPVLFGSLGFCHEARVLWAEGMGGRGW